MHFLFILPRNVPAAACEEPHSLTAHCGRDENNLHCYIILPGNVPVAASQKQESRTTTLQPERGRSRAEAGAGVGPGAGRSGPSRRRKGKSCQLFNLSAFGHF